MTEMHHLFCDTNRHNNKNPKHNIQTMDEFWDIQLNSGITHKDTCWLAPPEREQTISRRGVSTAIISQDDESCPRSYEWINLGLPCTDIVLNIRTIKSKVALFESHVGEELWDAAKLFCAHLCRTAASLDDKIQSHEDCIDHTRPSHPYPPVCGKRLRGKRVLELGAGVGTLGMCAAVLGADQVRCTDYDQDVMENLQFNIEHNKFVIDSSNLTHDESKITVSKLDWRSHLVQEIAWVDKSGLDQNLSEKMQEDKFEPDIVIGSALIYSAQGAICCADTIYHLLVEKHAKECWILQMPDRPGFQQFLFRLEYLGLSYESDSVSDETFHIAEQTMGKIPSNVEDFKLYIIRCTH